MAQDNSGSGSALATLGLDRDSGAGAMLMAAVDIARRYPRDPETILRTALATLDQHPEQAEKAIYSIPYEDRRRGRTVKVEGLSVRTAETLAALWGHLRIGVRIAVDDKDGYDLEAVAWDMQTNFQQLLPFRVSKWDKPRGGSAFLLDERRMLMVLQAGVSKVKRNVILSVLPTHVKLAYERKVRELLAKGPLMALAKPDVLKAVEESFAHYEVKPGVKVTLQDLEDRVGKPAVQWIGNDIADLRGLYSAIEDGEITAAQAFAPAEPESETTSTTGPARVVVTPLTISQGQATGQDADEKPRETRADPPPRRAARKLNVVPPAGKVEPEPASTQTASASAPVTVAKSLSEEDLQTTLDTIAAADSDGLDNLTDSISREGGAITRASRVQKTQILSAIAARRADL